MKYRVIVYFAGPKTTWAKKIDPSEVIFDAVVPWLWAARKQALDHVGNTGRCGYKIFQGERVVEESESKVRPYGSL